MSLVRSSSTPVLCAILLLAAHTAQAVVRPPADVPLNHWSYALLERLEARGIIDLDLTTLPVSRSDVVRALDEAPSSGRDASSEGLTERELWALERLREEFLRGGVDTPALSVESGEASFGLGVTVFTQGRYGRETVEKRLWPGTAPGGISPLRVTGVGAESAAAALTRDVGIEASRGSELDVAADVGYELWGGLTSNLGFYSDSQFLLGGQNGARQVRLSSRVRTWRGITVTSERAYFKLRGASYSVVAGRRATAWGRSRWGRLMLSGNAPTFDQLDVRYAVGPISFEAIHAILECDELGTETDLDESESVFLAGHRIVVSGDRGSVGIAESAVYSSVLPDPVYLNPLMPYYLAQHNERGNDNILWLIDGRLSVLRGLTAYGEFLIDDLQYERTTGAPDKYGATVGTAWYGSISERDAEMTLEYTNVRKWTYTHVYTEHRFAQDGVPIGFDLGPDADRFRGELVVHPWIEWSVGATFEHARKGEGTIDVPFVEGEDNEPTFPSGVVESVNRLAVEVGYQNLERLSAGAGAAYRSTTNVGHQLGEDDDEWEFWGGVEIRI